ncbi:MAG: zinc ribbon domain-containing protein [Promethearchaeota archaeon]|nr:MAG: zinc ribbon domain-containing protein [Candidatus Lokiarchaeota archaeon]
MSNVEYVEVLKEFQKFGERFFIIAILLVLGIFLDFLQFIAFIILLLALGNIKQINRELGDKQLKKFRSKIIRSIWVSFIGTIIMGIAAGVAFYIYAVEAHPIYYLIPANILVYGIILMFKSLAIQKKGWHKLHKFFKSNKEMFPKHIYIDVLDGTDKLEKACKYTMYIITIPIAIIYAFIGLFKLAELRKIPLYQKEPDHSYEKRMDPIPVKPKELSDLKARFCPSCGNKLTRPGRYCFACGYELTPSKAYA